jgi:aminoglycoside 6'-N-acetyltransferase I
MNVTPCTPAHVEAWVRLRHALWPTGDVAHRRADAEAMLHERDLVAFAAMEGSRMIGFAEAVLRRDYVNGCTTSPVAFLEGIYVDDTHRRRGVARTLVKAVEDWARAQGCREFASDANLDNFTSHHMHNALGFKETERVVYFKKML